MYLHLTRPHGRRRRIPWSGKMLPGGLYSGIEVHLHMGPPLLSPHATHGPQGPGPSRHWRGQDGQLPLDLSRVTGGRPRARRALIRQGAAGARTVHARTLPLAAHLGGYSGARPPEGPPRGPVTPSWSAVWPAMGTTWLSGA